MTEIAIIVVVTCGVVTVLVQALLLFVLIAAISKLGTDGVKFIFVNKEAQP